MPTWYQFYGVGQYIFDQVPNAVFARFLNGWYGHAGETLGFTTHAYKNDGLRGAALASAANTCGSSDAFLEALGLFTKDLNEPAQRHPLLLHPWEVGVKPMPRLKVRMKPTLQPKALRKAPQPLYSIHQV